MKTFEFNGWELYSTDGYTHQNVAYFANESDARTVMTNLKGNYYGVSAKKVSIRVFESVHEYYDQVEINKRESALAKLTKEDRIALGLE